MAAYAGPELFQLRTFIAMLIPPIQFNFDLLGLVLRRLGLTVIDIGRYSLASLGQCSHPVEFKTALLQLGRGPIPVYRASVTPHFRRRGIAGVSVTGCYSWRCVLLRAADEGGSKYC